MGMLKGFIGLLVSTSSYVFLHLDVQTLSIFYLLPPRWLLKVFFNMGTFSITLHLLFVESNDWDYGFCNKNWNINSFKTSKQFTLIWKKWLGHFRDVLFLCFSRGSPLSLMQSHGAPEPELLFSVNKQFTPKFFLSLCLLHL